MILWKDLRSRRPNVKSQAQSSRKIAILTKDLATIETLYSRWTEASPTIDANEVAMTFHAQLGTMSGMKSKFKGEENSESTMLSL